MGGDEVEEELMQELVSKIDKMYHRLSGTQQAASRKDEDGEKAGRTDLIPALVHIESQLHYLIEARDYWT